MSPNTIRIFILLAVLVILVGTPLVCIFVGLKRLKTSSPRGAKVPLWTGIIILAGYLSAVVAFVVWVGPARSGILAHGKSPTGQEYCVVQTFKGMVEPYQVSFYVRDSAGVWRWNYLAHQDVAWRSASVDFSNGVAHVSRNGLPFRDISLPTNTVDLSSVQPGYRDDYCPSNFTAENILEFHNSKFK